MTATFQSNPQADSIRLETEITGKDMSNTVVYNTFFKNSWLVPYIIILAAFCLFVIFAYYSGLFAFPFLLAAASIAILFVLVFSFMAAKMVGKGRTETKKRQYIIDSEGISTTLNVDDKPFPHPWKDVYEIRETGKYLFVYLNAADILIMPKRCFDQETLENLRAAIKKYMGSKRYRLKKY